MHAMLDVSTGTTATVKVVTNAKNYHLNHNLPEKIGKTLAITTEDLNTASADIQLAIEVPCNSHQP